MRRTLIAVTGAAVLGAAALGTGAAPAVEVQAPKGNFGTLDHVFLIMMENQTSTDIIGNPNAPFINEYASIANHATNYYAVGHPSAPNYLEIVGGSNFGLTGDYWPNWVDGGCIDNAPSSGCGGAFTPIQSPGTDNAVVSTATPGSSQCNGQITVDGNPPALYNCTYYGYAATTFTPQMIADQLVAKHKTWTSYQENLPAVIPGVAGINYSDGELSNLSPAADFVPGPIQKLYAVKHNPFVYFYDVEAGINPELSLARVKDFDGTTGLWADLETGNVSNLAFIVPNQCHDQHGYRIGRHADLLHGDRCRGAASPGPGRRGSRQARQWNPRFEGVEGRAQRHRPGLGRERLLEHGQSYRAAGRAQLREERQGGCQHL